MCIIDQSGGSNTVVSHSQLRCPQIWGSHPLICLIHIECYTIGAIQYTICVLIVSIKCPAMM